MSPETMTPNDPQPVYNYPNFTPEAVDPWMRFAQSPPLGEIAPDFPLWRPDLSPTSMSEIWSSNRYTVFEFGSFT